MDEAEFDRFADEYRQLHATNIRASGESPEFFAEYKVADLAALAPDLVRKSDARVLDFGAGTGTSVPWFRKYFPNARVTCLDVSRRSLDVGRSRFQDAAEFEHFDGGAVPYADASFDVVFVACVLHHIPHAEHSRIFAELRRVLKPNGVLLVFEHNPFNPLTVRAVNTCPFDENAVLLRPAALRRTFVSAGFADPSLRFRLFFPGPLRALRVIEPWLTWLPLGAQFSVHARRR